MKLTKHERCIAKRGYVTPPFDYERPRSRTERLIRYLDNKHMIDKWVHVLGYSLVSYLLGILTMVLLWQDKVL